MPEDIPGSVAAFGEQYASYALRQHLDAAHHLSAGRSYLVRREELPGFHDEAHAVPGRLAGWLRIRRLKKRRKARAWPI
jgi:hypothetical protein